MSRLTPTQSPSVLNERYFRSTNTASPSPTGNPGPSKRSILLSENQLNNINKKIANIRHGTVPEPIDTDMLSTVSSPDRHEETDRIDSFSVQIQEYAIIEDLLYILLGFDGTYIKRVYPKIAQDYNRMDVDQRPQLEDFYTWDQLTYTIDSTLDPSLKHLVEKILPLSTYYSSIDAFTETYSRYEYGMINHALTAAIKTFLKEYTSFIAQLEHQFHTSSTFTLHKLWFYAQDTLHSMKVLYDLVMTIRLVKDNVLEDEESDDIEAVIEGLTEKKASERKIPDHQKGGYILNILAERLIGLSGDPSCKKIYTFLLSKASAPYFDMLHSWIYHGEIMDPYSEFMIVEKNTVRKENLKEDFNDAYWEMRYTIREGSVPVFLEPMKNQILLAGKYLNVVRECGVIIADPEEMNQVANDELKKTFLTNNRTSFAHIPRSEVWDAVNGAQFAKNLEVAYKYASHTLLDLLMNEKQLIGRLRSLKHYFFLDQSDFLTSFLDLAKEELKQPASDISQTRLQSLMDLVLRNSSSVAAYDPYKEDIKVSMSHLKLVPQLLRIINVSGMEKEIRKESRQSSLFEIPGLERAQSLSGSTMSLNTKDTLTGYDALTIDYTVTFPLSLVISRKALTKYQLLFRLILSLKHVEDLLCNAWMDEKTALWKTRTVNGEIERWKFRTVSLRHRMLAFVQQFTYYVTNEVLEPNWRRLESNLMTVSTVDQVLQYHSDFLDTCLKQCMLTTGRLLQIFEKLIKACIKFTTLAEKFNRVLNQLEEEQSQDVFGMPKVGLKDTPTTIVFENSQRRLGEIEHAFVYHMNLLIEELHLRTTEETQFLCLLVRLDYNQFYNKNENK